jgi:hypothetical protein
MERGTGDRNLLDEFVIDFCKIIDKHCKYIVVSGFVAISHGRTRSTEDIDMIIEKIDFSKFKELHIDLEKNGFECLQSSNPKVLFEDYLTKCTSIRYIKKGEYIPELELKFAKDKLDEMQIETRVKLPLTGLDIYFSSVETNIAFKEELLASKKDMEDADHLRKIYKDKISEENIVKIKKMIREMRLN